METGEAWLWEVSGRRVRLRPCEEVNRVKTMKALSWAIGVSPVGFRKE